MGLLGSAVLAGLVALGVPLLLHLVDRVESDGRRFPSLMFVRRLEYRTTRRRTLRDRPLLLLRCLALLALTLAFARPFTADEVNPVTRPARDLVLLLDRSYSMAAGERWRLAREAAETELATLESDARVALVLFDIGAEVVHGLDDQPAAARGALSRATPGVAGGDLAAALGTAAALLSASPAVRREVLLISDLQRVSLAEAAPLELPQGVELRVLAVGDAPLANASLERVAAHAGVGGSDGLLRLRLQRRGALPLAPGELRLWVDGRAAGVRRVEPGTSDTLDVEFPLPAASSRPMRVAASISGDDLAVDDQLFLVLAPDAPLRVLLVEPDTAPATRGVFIERALAVADAPAVQVRRVAVSGLDAELLASADVVVLDDCEPAGEALAALRARVLAGAGLLLVSGERLGQSWPEQAAGWWPGRPGAVREVSAVDGANIEWRAFVHPIAGALSVATPGGGGLLPAGVRRYRRFEPTAEDTVLAVFDDEAPAIIERGVGAGRVVLLATTLDARWNGLAAQPVFVPLVVELVRHLASRGAARAAFRIGEVVDLARHAAAQGAVEVAAALRAGATALVEMPDGSSRPLVDGLLLVTQPGFHDIHATGSSAPAVPLAVVADTRESDPAVLSVRELMARVVTEPLAPQRQLDVAEQRLADAGSDRLWWWLALAALLLSAAESLLAARMQAVRGPALLTGGAK